MELYLKSWMFIYGGVGIAATHQFDGAKGEHAPATVRVGIMEGPRGAGRLR